jgi:hypothetical protein
VDADPSAVGLYPRLVELLIQTGRPEEATNRLLVFHRVPNVSAELRRRRILLLASMAMWDQAVADCAALEPLGAPDDRLSYARISARVGDLRTATRLL